ALAAEHDRQHPKGRRPLGVRTRRPGVPTLRRQDPGSDAGRSRPPGAGADQLLVPSVPARPGSTRLDVTGPDASLLSATASRRACVSTSWPGTAKNHTSHRSTRSTDDASSYAPAARNTSRAIVRAVAHAPSSPIVVS